MRTLFIVIGVIWMIFVNFDAIIVDSTQINSQVFHINRKDRRFEIKPYNLKIKINTIHLILISLLMVSAIFTLISIQ